MGQYPWTEVALFLVLHILVFYPTRNRLYRLVVLFAMFYAAARLYLTSEVPNPPKFAYTLGNTIGFYFTFTTYLLCAEGTFPDHWRRVRDEVRTRGNPGGLNNLPSNFPFVKKLWWMLDITHSPRMVGWVREPREHLPPHPPPSRPAFLWKTFAKFLVNAFLIPELLALMLSQTPQFGSRLHDSTDRPEISLAGVPLLHRVPYALAHIIRTASAISAPHNFLAFVFVGLGLSDPTLWPDMWGRWEDAFTIRKIWGYVVLHTLSFHKE